MLIGIQTVAFNELPLDQALQQIARPGLSFVEIARDHASLAQLAQSPELLERLRSLGLQLVSNDPVPLENDPRLAREAFELARHLGLCVLNIDAAPETLPLLEGLSAEFEIPVAIHNQGPETQWATAASFETALHDLDRRVGMCVDTGLFLRVPEDPLKILHEFCDRIHSIYLRDIETDEEGDTGEEHALGEGTLDLNAIVAELDRLQFPGPVIIRYEGTENPEQALEKALERIRQPGHV